MLQRRYYFRNLCVGLCLDRSWCIVLSTSKTTFYIVDEEHLICHIFGFKKKIPLKEITKIEPQKGIYAGLKINTSWRGIVVYYGKWNEILISPSDESGFIAAIRAKNPNLLV